jgi:hypothetical protein
MSRRPQLPNRTFSAKLIVCERTGQWAVALRRELPPRVRIFETRSVPECWRTLAASPAGFVVAELTRSNGDALLTQLSRLERHFPSARVAVVAERVLADWQWLVREAGAVHFTTSVREAKPLAALALRHLRRAPLPRLGLAERIWAELPWGQGP